MAVVGRNYTLCHTIHARGLNGTAYWSVNGLRVNATDRTTPPDVNNFVALDCTVCSCMRRKYDSYLRSGFVSGNPKNYSAVIISLHTYTEKDELLRRKLCDYGDVTLALLGVESVEPGDGVMQVNFLVADSASRYDTESVFVETGKAWSDQWEQEEREGQVTQRGKHLVIALEREREKGIPS